MRELNKNKGILRPLQQPWNTPTLKNSSLPQQWAHRGRVVAGHHLEHKWGLAADLRGKHTKQTNKQKKTTRWAGRDDDIMLSEGNSNRGQPVKTQWVGLLLTAKKWRYQTKASPEGSSAFIQQRAVFPRIQTQSVWSKGTSGRGRCTVTEWLWRWRQFSWINKWQYTWRIILNRRVEQFLLKEGLSQLGL